MSRTLHILIRSVLVLLLSCTPAQAFLITVDVGDYSLPYKIDGSVNLSGDRTLDLAADTHTFSSIFQGIHPIPPEASFTFVVDGAGNVTSNQPSSAVGSGSNLLLNNISVLVDPDDYPSSYKFGGGTLFGAHTFVMVPDLGMQLVLSFVSHFGVSASAAGVIFVSRTDGVVLDGVTSNPNATEFPDGFGDIFTFTVLAQDADGDGVPDDVDQCLISDLSPTVVIDDCDSGVANTLGADGCTISDRIDELAANATNHGNFSSSVAHLLNDLKKDGVITGVQKGVIQSCAGQAGIP